MDTHFFLGSKGGIGKSLASSFLASFFQRNEQAVHCFDTDPQNHTLGGYTAFPVKAIQGMLQGVKGHSKKTQR